MDACHAPSGAIAWTATVPPAEPSLALVDVVAGPTGDVVLADMVGTSSFEQHRWSSAGAFVASHTDDAGAYAGRMFASGLFPDANNGVFYGLARTGLPMGTDLGVELTWNRLDPTGTVLWTAKAEGSAPASSGQPSITVLRTGGDASANLHGTYVMAAPESVRQGVYCYDYKGDDFGASAQNLTGLLTSKDFLWPTRDNNLVLFKEVTSTVDLGCGAPLAVPAEGGAVLGKFSGGGACLWTKLLALPAEVVKATNFRLGADGSMLAAVVYAGTVDFGGGPLQSAGESALALARFDAAGKLAWAKSFGGAGARMTVGSVGSSADGHVVLTGGYAGDVDLGAGMLSPNGDAFVAVFDAAGRLQWARTVTVGAQGALMAFAGPCGPVVATNSPSVDLGAGPLVSVAKGVAGIGVAALGM